MEYEVRFYYPKKEIDLLINKLNNIEVLRSNTRKYEKTIQYNHPNKEYNFYSKEIDGRFRLRITKDEDNSSSKISWKKRITNNDINKEEEVEISINSDDYDNTKYLLENVLHLELVECYERYRTTYTNEEIEIALDEYPFGIALELEVKKEYNNRANEIINKYIKLLDLDINKRYKLSWDDKYEELCKKQNIKHYKEVTFDKEMPEVK